MKRFGVQLAVVMLIMGSMVACSGSLKLTSTPPDAVVYDGDKKIGQTPVDISSDTIKSEVADGYLLRIERDGFNKVWVWVPSGMKGLNVDVNLQPFVKRESVDAKQMPRSELDSVSARLLSIETDLLVKGSVGDDVIKSLVNTYPEVGAAHYLAAIHHLRKGAKDQALEEAARAMRLSPNEPDYVVLYREIGGNPEATSPAKPGGDAGKGKTGVGTEN